MLSFFYCPVKIQILQNSTEITVKLNLKKCKLKTFLYDKFKVVYCSTKSRILDSGCSFGSNCDMIRGMARNFLSLDLNRFQNFNLYTRATCISVSFYQYAIVMWCIKQVLNFNISILFQNFSLFACVNESFMQAGYSLVFGLYFYAFPKKYLCITGIYFLYTDCTLPYMDWPLPSYCFEFFFVLWGFPFPLLEKSWSHILLTHISPIIALTSWAYNCDIAKYFANSFPCELWAW